MNPHKKEKNKNRKPASSPVPVRTAMRPGGRKEDKRTEKILSYAIFAFAFLLYANTLNHGYVLDDDVVYLKNRHVQEGLGGIKEIVSNSFIHGFTGNNDQSYRPLVLIVYAIEKTFLGNKPSAQHFVNVLLFAFSCVLLYKLMKKIFTDFKFPHTLGGQGGYSFLLPLVITLLFASHPIHTEAVANIKGLDDILCFLFLVLTLLFTIQYVESGKKIKLILSVLCFFLSLLCKEVAVTFLAIIPLTLYFFTKTTSKKITSVALYLLAGFGFYMIIRGSVLESAVTFTEKMQVINNALVAANSESERIGTALYILFRYILLLFFPHPLSWDYSYNQIPLVGFSDIKVIITLLIFGVLGVYALITFRKKNIFSYCILFFFLSMSVVSNLFIMIGSTLGERFLFTPSIAFCIAVPFLFSRFGKNIFLGMIGGVVVVFSLKTFLRNQDWKDNLSLFAAGVEATPNSSRAESALGSSYREMGEKEPDPSKRAEFFQKAIVYYKKAIEILPDNTEALYNAGVSYYGMGDKENALKVYEQALKVSPEYTNAANNAGVIYFERKDYENAKKYFLLAIKYSPNNSDALGNLGAINHNQGNLKEAVDFYKRALAINPGNQNVKSNLAMVENALLNH